MRATGSLGALPLAVLTAGGWAEDGWVGKIPPGTLARMQAEHERMQGELAALSTNSTHVVVPDSGHFIQIKYPDVVVDAIAAAVETARDGGRISERLPPG